MGSEKTAGLRISGISFAHPHTTEGDRSRLVIPEDRLRNVYQRIAEAGIDAFVLSTCLRIEIVSTGCEAALERVLEIIYPDLALPESGVRFQDEEALVHLSRIASGLASPIIGEPEVLAQFRQAIQTARQVGVVGGTLGKLLDAAVANGRAARRMLPVTPEGSLATVAAELAHGSPEVAVFGAGSMARAAVEGLLSQEPAPKVTVYARRPDGVRFHADTIRPLDDAPAALAETPVVISATAAKRELFDTNVLAAALDRRDTPLLLIDLAMPPDFTPSEEMAGLTYVNLDALADRARREQVAGELEEFVAHNAAEQWSRTANRHLVGPVITAILHEIDLAVQEEVDRFTARIENANGDARAVAGQLAQTVAHRVLHRPLSYLGAGKRAEEAASLLAEIFGVDRG